jgi:tRNA-specific 2-thiouridylase
VKCNQSVKFKDLLQTARELGADCMATGHYVQRMQQESRAQMHRAADLTRDQSYFLFATTQEQLDFLRFPLGHLKSKEETRALAARFGLTVADKPDSQDICFVPSGGYAKVVEKLRPGALEPGEIVHVDGRVLGRHDGIINYTVGQRKGLGIGGTVEPLFVVKLDAAKKQVIVGAKEDLLVRQFTLRECNWLDAQQLKEKEVMVKLRSMHPGVKARVHDVGGGRALVELAEPQAAVSPGQACVAYDGDRMIGGGWITAA